LEKKVGKKIGKKGWHTSLQNWLAKPVVITSWQNHLAKQVEKSGLQIWLV
jgi:hypothetical protein|tara:strand:- start:422 stop:571 length:150 start_codon:yes stop_codon:yes gene_type:complete